MYVMMYVHDIDNSSIFTQVYIIHKYACVYIDTQMHTPIHCIHTYTYTYVYIRILLLNRYAGYLNHAYECGGDRMAQASATSYADGVDVVGHNPHMRMVCMLWE